MTKCRLYEDVERLKIAEPECGHTGERLIGHNLALGKAIGLLEACPRFPPSGYTEWHVVVRQKEDGTWEPVGCIEESMDDDDEQYRRIMREGWDLILAIPDPEGAPEWDGF